MASTRLEHVVVRGVVASVPGPPQRVRDFAAPFDGDAVTRMMATVGLETVYRARDGQTAGDLCQAAALHLLERLGWAPESIDGLVLVTQTPDHFLPATACVLHGRLGLPTTAFAFDVGMGCSGYVYGLWLASQFVSTGAARRVLLLAGDTISHVLSPDDQSVAMLFGDAGSATAVEYDEHAEPSYFSLGTDGSGAADLVVPAGAFRSRPCADTSARAGETGARRAPGDLYMDGLAVFNFTLSRVPRLVEDVLALSQWPRESVDAYLFHQANAFILQKIARKLRIADDAVPLNIGRYGNTSVASIPLLMCDGAPTAGGRTTPTRTVLAGFGVGLSWAGAAITVPPLGVADVVTV